MLYYDPAVELKGSSHHQFGFAMYLCFSDLARLTRESQSSNTIAFLAINHGSYDYVEASGSRMQDHDSRSGHLFINDYHPARICRARTMPDTDRCGSSIRRDPTTDHAVLRAEEMEAGYPIAPRSPEFVEYTIKYPIPNAPHMRYESALSGDVTLVQEQEVHSSLTHFVVER